MVDAFKKMIDNWKDVNGKTNRPDYWWATLAEVLVTFVACIIPGILLGIGAGMDNGASAVFVILGIILCVVVGVLVIFLAIADITMTVRRLRDAGFPWWLIFVNFIPSVGQIALVVLLCFPSTDTPVFTVGVGTAATQAAPSAPVENASPIVDVTPEEAPVVDADAWICPACGAACSGKFCPKCGTAKPE